MDPTRSATPTAIAQSSRGAPPASIAAAGPAYTLSQLARYFLTLGTIGFGGPVALIEYMRRDLVEGRRWISEADYMEGLALSQLAPGPLAAQLAIYIGFVHYRVLGATVAGLAFVLPSFLMVLALGWAYTLYGGLSWVQAVFYAVGAAVIGIIAFSAYKLTRKSIGQAPLLWSIYLVSAAVTVITESEKVLLFLAAGVLVWLVRAPPKTLLARSGQVRVSVVSTIVLAILAALENGELLWRLFTFFTYAGAFVFGSGLAIVPFLYGGVVNDYGWLNEQQFLDAVAVALITPGPVVITTGFIGFLIAGPSGATVASVATFLPAYLFTILPAPYFRKYGKVPAISAFVDGVTAAAIGAISGAVIVLGRRSVIDLPTLLIAIVVILLLWKKKMPEPVIVLAAGVIGLILFPFVRG